MKKFFITSLALMGAPALALAEDNPPAVTVTPIVDPTSIQTTLTSSLTPWVTVGIGIGISVFVVYLGWRLLKRFTR